MADGNAAERRPLDAYFTPPALAGVCLSWLVRDGFYRAGTVLEPSCGMGAFVAAARTVAGNADIDALDINPEHRSDAYNAGATRFRDCNFLSFDGPETFDLIVGNPPFSDALAHVEKALSLRSPWGSVAFLLRLAFLETQERRPFWKQNPASKVYVFSQRPSFTGGGTDSAAYGLFVWQRGWTRPTELEVVSWR